MLLFVRTITRGASSRLMGSTHAILFQKQGTVVDSTKLTNHPPISKPQLSRQENATIPSHKKETTIPPPQQTKPSTPPQPEPPHPYKSSSSSDMMSAMAATASAYNILATVKYDSGDSC